MKNLLPGLVLTFFAAVAAAQNPGAPVMETWRDHVEHGLVPYHQLTVDDFAVNDKAHPGNPFWVKPFVNWRSKFNLHAGGLFYAYVSEWKVFHGLDKNRTSRKSSFHDMKEQLPFAQALLDINELHARELASLMPGDLPRGSGQTAEAAQRDLEGQLKVFCAKKYDEIQAESDAFVKETNGGQNKKKVRELAAAITKRLDAIPVTNPFLPAASSAPVTSPVPTATPPASASPR